MALLEERKKKLAAEGLFDEARKQLLPFLPRVIGVVTSPTGAVIRDILHRLADRFPRHVLVWPVRVQGEGAAAEVAAAIEGFNALPEAGAMPRPDRADRRARRRLARRPVGVQRRDRGARGGREHDPADLRRRPRDRHDADRSRRRLRAPTPTAAAEMAVPVRAELLSRRSRPSPAHGSLLAARTGPSPHRTARGGTCAAGADALLAVPRQRLDAAGERLPRALRANAHVHHQEFARLAGRLSLRLLTERTKQCLERVEVLARRGKVARETYLARRRDRLISAGQLLNAFSYRGVLSRGFALVRDADGHPLRAAASVSAGARLEIELSDGRIGATADGATGGVTAPKEKPRKGPAWQGTLF